MITRFAPSPTGPLHLGHAFAGFVAHDMARAAGGQFVLRIEDIDATRARPEWEALIYDDLHWLGLEWPTHVLRQSSNLPAYTTALRELWDMGLLYVCTCNRRDIQAAVTAPQEGTAATGPDGLIYPGTCRTKPRDAVFPLGSTLRLDINKAVQVIDIVLNFVETGNCHGIPQGHIATTPDHYRTAIGDVVLARRDMGASYHLAVVIDDAAQGVTHVTRGADLFEATRIHVLLQRLLNLPTPVYHHHRLIRDDHGKRLAKRDDARAIATYRADGATPAEIRKLVGL